MDKTKSCRHFAGIQRNECRAGVPYTSVRSPTLKFPANLPCHGDSAAPSCEKYATWTAEELAEKDREMRRHVELLEQGLSGCCEAPLDESHVIRQGRHKGHGPRYCSKCHKVVFMV